MDHFGRLKKTGFAAVLSKHLARVPLAAGASADVSPGAGAMGDLEAARRRLTREVTAWLFSPNGSDHGVVELTFAGSTAPVLRHRRDLLTGALVDRAVQDAAKAARREQIRTSCAGFVTFELLVRAFESQFRALVDQLTEMNVRHYVDLPDGVRVARLRRVPQPRLASHEFPRVAPETGLTP